MYIHEATPYNIFKSEYLNHNTISKVTPKLMSENGYKLLDYLGNSVVYIKNGNTAFLTRNKERGELEEKIEPDELLNVFLVVPARNKN